MNLDPSLKKHSVFRHAVLYEEGDDSGRVHTDCVSDILGSL